jgi:hypothetical protein
VGETLIDRHTISWDHLAANGLVMWIVQMMKWGLWKYGLHQGHTRNWDIYLSWLIMGYNFN